MLSHHNICMFRFTLHYILNSIRKFVLNKDTMKYYVILISIKNNAFNIVNAQTLSASASTEILTLPLVVEGGKLLKVTMSSTDSVTIGISYLNIKKEVTV